MGIGTYSPIWEDLGRLGKTREDLGRLGKNLLNLYAPMFISNYENLPQFLYAIFRRHILGKVKQIVELGRYIAHQHCGRYAKN